MGAVIAGPDEYEQLEQPDDESSVDAYAQLGFKADLWPPDALLAHSLVARSLENDWKRVCSHLRNLPKDGVLVRRLDSGLRLAAKELIATSTKATTTSTAAAPERGAYQQAIAAICDLQSRSHSPTWYAWCDVTSRLHAAGKAWRRARWVDAHGNQTNQSLRVQLLKEEARVRQYALLMRGSGQRYRAMLLLDALSLLLSTGKRHATVLGVKWSGKPSKRLQSLFDIDVVEPEIREQWALALAGPLKRCGALIRIARRDGQKQPWMLHRHYRQFVKKGLVGGKSDATRKRRIVEELLAPMQALGLAAQVPWDRVLRADSSRNKTPPQEASVTLDTCHGKAWVVNPLGIVSPPRKRSRKR